jgi:hypothetical protein
MGWVQNFLRQEPQDMFFGPVRPTTDGSGSRATPTSLLPGTPVPPESAYLHLYLEGMRISAVRDRGQTLFGSVTSACGVESHSGRAELVTVSTLPALRGVDSRHLNRVITATVPLIDAVPYRGGRLDVEIGLAAFPERYLLGPYLDFLGDVAAVASAFLSPTEALATAALMPSVRRGLDHLFGASSGAKLEIGLVHTWEPPVTGHYAVVRAPQPPGGFRVAADSKLFNPDGTEVRAPYMVLRLDARSERYNWPAIPDIATAYKTVKSAVLSGDVSAATWALETFRRITLVSPDLLADDGKRLHAEVKKLIEEVMPATAPGGLVPASGTIVQSAANFPDLADISLYARTSTHPQMMP